MIYFYNPDKPDHIVVWDRHIKNDRVVSKLLTYYRKRGYKKLKPVKENTDTLRRMSDAYKARKRKQKIEKLKKMKSHLKGLS